MTTTYATDEEVVAACPQASPTHRKSLIAADDTLDRVRVEIAGRIDRELARRGIDSADLADRDEVTACEVYGVIAELHFRAASRAGLDGQDWFTQEGKRYRTMHEHELAFPFSLSGDVATVPVIKLRRG